MNYIIVIGGCILVVCILMAVGIMVNIRLIINRINNQLLELDSKLKHVPFPKTRLVNLEQFALRIRKIVNGIRSIRPDNN